MTELRTDYDHPWKEIIETFFPQFMEFFFPSDYKIIDWEKGYEFLDQELQKLEPDAEIGKRLVDKVAKVWLLDGQEAWVLAHIEVQAQYDKYFPERMYTYNYRLYDRHKRKVMSLAILADDDKNWRPDRDGYEIGGSGSGCHWSVAKLVDYEDRWEYLETTTNPFGLVVMAHLKTKATNLNPETRLHWKLTLVRMLFTKGYSREQIQGLFRFIDWVMLLPKELSSSFKQELINNEETRMRYITSIEVLAKEEGIIEQARKDIIQVLKARLGEVPNSIVESINQIDGLSQFQTLLIAASTTSNFSQFQQVLSEITIQ